MNERRHNSEISSKLDSISITVTAIKTKQDIYHGQMEKVVEKVDKHDKTLIQMKVWGIVLVCLGSIIVTTAQAFLN